MASNTIVTVEHSMATNGLLIPTSDLEVKRTITAGLIRKEEYYQRGYVFARFYTWDGSIIDNNFSTAYMIPSNAADWNKPNIKPKKVADYPFTEFYPWQALKLVAMNVHYDKWKTGDYTIGDNAWAE